MKDTLIRRLWLSLLGLQSCLLGLPALTRVSKVVEQLPDPQTNGAKILLIGGGKIDDRNNADWGKYDLICFSNSSLSLAPEDFQSPIVWFFTPALNRVLDRVDIEQISFMCVGNPPRWGKKSIQEKVNRNPNIPAVEFQVIQESDKSAKSSLIYKGFRKFVWLTTGMTGLLWVLDNYSYSSVDILGYDLYELDSCSTRLGHSLPVERKILKELLRLSKATNLGI